MENPFEEVVTRLIRVESLLYELKSTVTPAPTENTQDKIGGIELAMQVTGLAKSTVYNLASESRIPHMKRGKKLYFSREELLSWLREGKQKTLSDLKEEMEAHLSRQSVR